MSCWHGSRSRIVWFLMFTANGKIAQVVTTALVGSRALLLKSARCRGVVRMHDPFVQSVGKAPPVDVILAAAKRTLARLPGNMEFSEVRILRKTMYVTKSPSKSYLLSSSKKAIGHETIRACPTCFVSCPLRCPSSRIRL